MNSELSAAGESRIIIPTLYREQYLDCLRAMTRQGLTDPYVRAMTTIRDWTAEFAYDDLDALIESLTKCNAFERSLISFRLLRPSDVAEAENEVDEDAVEWIAQKAPGGG